MRKYIAFNADVLTTNGFVLDLKPYKLRIKKKTSIEGEGASSMMRILLWQGDRRKSSRKNHPQKRNLSYLSMPYRMRFSLWWKRRKEERRKRRKI